MNYQDYSLPVRLGLRIRKKMLSFAASYGGKFFFIRRPIAVFFNTLLDDKHQETFKGTMHERYKNNHTL